MSPNHSLNPLNNTFHLSQTKTRKTQQIVNNVPEVRRSRAHFCATTVWSAALYVEVDYYI